jgi:hypothetical protein
MRITLFMMPHIIFAMIFVVSCRSCGERLLTEQQIIGIANAKAKSEGIPLKESNIYYDVGNKDWRVRLASLRKDSPDYVKERDNFNELKGHNYQTVIYTPKNVSTLGGVLYVFVDRSTGEVITIHGEE